MPMLPKILTVLVTLTLAEMMFAMGLRVSPAAVIGSIRQQAGVAVRAFAVNYLVVPLLTLAAIWWSGADAATAAGLLILAVCPGAPYGPPFTVIARGNLPLALGMMVLLAASSALLSPVLLHLLLAFTPAGSGPLHFDAGRMAASLLVIQLLPLLGGLMLRQYKPSVAERLSQPATVVSKVLNGLMITAIVLAQFNAFGHQGWPVVACMLLLAAASLGAGYLRGGSTASDRRTLAIITALRNMSLGMVIATGAFAGTPVITTVLTYAVVSGTLLLIVALGWGSLKKG